MVVNDVQDKDNQDIMNEHPVPGAELESIGGDVHQSYEEELHNIREKLKVNTIIRKHCIQQVNA